MKKKPLYIAVLFTLIAVILSFQVYKIEPFESFSLRFNDINFKLQKKEPNQNIVFVAIDEPSVNEYGRWPWDREILAKGIDKLYQSDIVLMDMIFSEPTTEKKDNILANSISKLNASVCGFFLRHNSTQSIDQDTLDILSDSSIDLLQSQIAQYKNPSFISAKYAEINILRILEACTLSGSFSTLSQTDLLLRSYPIGVYYDDILYPSLAIQGLRILYNKDISRIDKNHVEINNKQINLNNNGFVRLNYYKPNQYKTISFLDITTNKIKPEYFKNKIVILGVTDVGAGDIVSTPIGAIPGPLLHYTFLSNLLEDHLIKEVNYISYILTAIMILMPFIMILLSKNIVYRVILNITIYILVYIFIRYLFISYMIFIDMFYPLIALFISLGVFEIITFNIQEKGSRFIKDAFSSYLSSELLNQLIQSPQSLSLGGEKKELTILFSDIRKFTNLSESMDPISLINLLNRYFTPMTNSVLKNNGMLDKYIGDAIMAFFNAPVSIQYHAKAACRCALEMIEQLNKLNIQLQKESISTINIGIGINTADVVVGNMGSDTRFNYTAIGDGVNLASRVEGLTSRYNIDILITEFTVNQLDEDFVYRKIEAVKVKGKKEAVLLYQLLPNNKEAKEIKELYDIALQNYINQDLYKAKAEFTNLVNKYDDKLSKYFLKQIQNNHSWGICEMKTK